MNKEQEIRSMLEYLTKRYGYSSTRKRADGIFETPNLKWISVADKQESQCFTIDFNKKTIEVYVWDESGHNGDHFNYYTENVNWEHLLTGYDSFLNQTRAAAKAEAVRKLENQLADISVEKILSGKNE